MRLIFVLINLFFVSSVWADIGSVTELTGTAIIKRGKDTISVSKGTTIVMNDKVETKNGRVKITFKDNTTVNITESSSMVIDDFVYDPKSGAGKLNLKATAGTVRYSSGNIAHNNPNAVNIKTPTAAIAVRGTDFVMAVNEVGGSMVMLMPSCEVEQNVNLKGLSCGSGAIDVETPAGIVKMNKPYQATLVETANQAPSPPITVNLSGMGIGNNLMITPPKTQSGASIVAAARAAAEKTGDAKREEKKDDNDSKDQEKNHVAQKQDSSNNKESSEEKTEIKKNDSSIEDLASQVGSRETTDNEFVFKLYKDKSNTMQIGWQWESLSPSGKNYSNVVMPMDTKVQVVVSQDMIVNSYNFGPGGKPQGSITIVQQYR